MLLLPLGSSLLVISIIGLTLTHQLTRIKRAVFTIGTGVGTTVLLLSIFINNLQHF